MERRGLFQRGFMKSRRKTYLLYASLIILGVGLLFILTETVRAKNTGFETKTLWDWMELLIIPLVLALGIFFLNQSERVVERETANKRAELEREIAKDRQQEAALQSYIERMSELLIEKKLRTTKIKEIRDVARTLTVSVMHTLDKDRNNLVIQFLREAQLITDKKSVLNGANMEGMNLQGLDFRHVFMQSANLSKANLQGTSFLCANLQEASFWEADLQSADFENAVLLKAYLAEANLQGANLAACLREVNFEGANLQKTFMHGADLKYANLIDANLQEAQLFEAELQEAILAGADLQGANLTAANFEGADVDEEQLKTAAHIDFLIMPDGTMRESSISIVELNNKKN